MIKKKPVPFALVCRAHGLPEPEAEVCLTSHRKFCWDFVWRDHHLCLEVQGGIFRKGGHSTGLGITRDMTKLNTATLLGYRSLQVTPATLTAPDTVDLLRWLLLGAGRRPLPDLLAALPPQGAGSSRRIAAGRTSRGRGRR